MNLFLIKYIKMLNLLKTPKCKSRNSSMLHEKDKFD